MVEWTTDRPKRRRKYRPILETVKAEQAEHPRAWAEIARFHNVQTGHACAYQLKGQYTEEGFEFRSALDQRTREVVVYSRYMGGSDD